MNSSFRFRFGEGPRESSADPFCLRHISVDNQEEGGVTERHDPAPISPSQDDPHGPHRGRRPVLSSGARILSTRFPVVIALALVTVVMIGLALVAADRAKVWLLGQPDFLLNFDRIELRPNPPDSMRGGAAALLQMVREEGKLGVSIRVLDLDLSALATAFVLHSPWVSHVKSIDRSTPGRLIVDLEYREPVARIEIDRNRSLTVASDCALLPTEDVTAQVLKDLPVLSGLRDVKESRPGLFLGDDGQGRIDPNVQAAVAMANVLRAAQPLLDPIARIDLTQGVDNIWLLTRSRFSIFWRHPPGLEAENEPDTKKKLSIIADWETMIRAMPSQDPNGISTFAKLDVSKGREHVTVQTRSGLWVHWRHLDGEEATDEPSAREKLAAIRQWESMQGDKPRNPRDYLEIDRSGAYLHSTR